MPISPTETLNGGSFLLITGVCIALYHLDAVAENMRNNPVSLARLQAPFKQVRMLLRKLRRENKALRTTVVKTTYNNQRLKNNLGL